MAAEDPGEGGSLGIAADPHRFLRRLRQDFYRSDVTVANSNDTEVSAVLWHGADCYLQETDTGYGFFDTATNGIYCTQNPNNSPAGRLEGFVPLSADSRYYEGSFGAALSDPGPNGFPNTCECDQLLDNGMALSWNITVPASGSTSRSFLTTLSPRGQAFDNIAPETTITAGPSGTTGDSSPTFGFVSSEQGGGFECSVDSAPFAACTSEYTTAALGDGPHNFEVRATDGSGTGKPGHRSFTVDTQPSGRRCHGACTSTGRPSSTTCPPPVLGRTFNVAAGQGRGLRERATLHGEPVLMRGPLASARSRGSRAGGSSR